MSHHPDDDAFPFTATDFHQVLRLFMSDTEALQTARLMAGEGGDLPEAKEGRRVSGASISTDFLILMSLLSDELREKVDRYCKTMEAFFGRPEEQQRWNARREELKKVLDSGQLKPPS
jgi:hypothetical protein